VTTASAFLAAGVFFAATGALAADVVTFPSAGCAGTLQQCIDGAGAGDTIEIATNALIDEDLTIEKSLTLKSASGFTGTIGKGESLTRVVNIQDSIASGAIAVTLDGIVLQNARIAAVLNLFAAGGHRVEVLRTHVSLDIDENNTPAVAIDVRVPATAVVQRNVIDSTGQAIQIFSGPVGGSTAFTVDGNVLTTSNPAASTNGVDMSFFGGGTVVADVVNNSVSMPTATRASPARAPTSGRTSSRPRTAPPRRARPSPAMHASWRPRSHRSAAVSARCAGRPKTTSRTDGSAQSSGPW
jgi:hypothetical protein